MKMCTRLWKGGCLTSIYSHFKGKLLVPAAALASKGAVDMSSSTRPAETLLPLLPDLRYQGHPSSEIGLGRAFHSHSLLLGRKAKKEKKPKSGSKRVDSFDLDSFDDVIDTAEYLKSLETIMNEFRSQMSTQLALRTSIRAIEQLPVNTDDGDRLPLSQLGQVVQKSPKLILVNLVGAPQTISQVRTAISQSALNINPQQEGTTLLLPIPKVTVEHRETLVKSAKMLCNKTKDKLRDCYSRFNRKLKKSQGEGMSKDLLRDGETFLRETMQSCLTVADEEVKKKQTELLTG